MSTYGYKMVMNEFYSYAVKSEYIKTTLRSQCNNNSRLCVGGSDKSGTTLQLVACGNCFVITTPTDLNKPVLINGVYWYCTPDRSFGYSPVYRIDQNIPDLTDCHNDWGVRGVGGDERYRGAIMEDFESGGRVS